MWMVESSDRREDFQTTIGYPIFSRKRVRQLMPTSTPPICSSTIGKLSPTPTPVCCCEKHNPSILTGYDGLSLVSTRWNPTPEQLQALEEMYRRGIRTPTSEQIRQIAGRLRRFGKIEGKNVFYWFQNHKARERQKKRRQLEFDCVEPKQTGSSKKYMQSEHPKKSGGPSNCGTPSEASVSKHRAEESECDKTVGLMTHFELNLQHMKAAKESIEICCNLNLSSCMFPTPISAQNIYAAQENENPLGGLNLGIPFPSKSDDLKSFEGGIQENSRILQLFPVGSIDDFEIVDPIEEENDGVTRNYETRFRVDYEFFEFLPTKN